MDFDWDAANIDHIALHAITAAEAEEAVGDPRATYDRWYIRNDEVRLNIMGGGGGRLLSVVITTRGHAVRVVSARPANRPERRRYRDERP